jgi:glyoxylase-like metal-dependent hydrolase (beta-lactamase superfamily II)
LLAVSILLTACSESKAPPLAGAIQVSRLSERVFVASGRQEPPSAANQGFVNNPAFVLARKGVVVIDPGASLQVGEWLLERVREVTPLPVVAVINTQADPVHWLGNHAIRNAYPSAVIYSSASVIDRLKSDSGAAALAHINQITNGAARGTRPVLPDLAVEPGESLRLSGLTFRIPEMPESSAGLVVEIVGEQVVFGADSSALSGDWFASLPDSTRYVVPGRGPVVDRARTAPAGRTASKADPVKPAPL